LRRKEGAEKLLETVIDLLGYYDLPRENLTISRIKKGHIGSNFKVCSKRGAFVLRIRHPQFSKEMVLEDHSFLGFLRKNEFPVPQIIANRKGETCGITEEKKVFELQEFIPHNSTAEEKSYAEISGKLAGFLGKYHALAGKFPREISKMAYLGEIPLGFWEKYFSGPLEKGRERYLQTARNARGEICREIKDRTFSLADRLEGIKKKLEVTYPELPRLVNHNDFYGNNILFQGEKIAGLVDFDFCSTGIFYIDLIELLHGSMVWQDGEEKYWGLHPEGRVRLDQGRRDLEHYLESGPGFEVDMEILKELLISKIISLAWYPAFDIVQGEDARLQVLKRLDRTIKEIDKL